MKKIFLSIAIVMALLLTGCGALSEDKIKDNFIKGTENLKSYYIEGEMSLTNNDDTYKYDVKVSYQKDENYRVVLTNKANNYQQIILKNSDGVYVISPSINKSFKFQSTWPNNNSQVYLLGSLATDLKNDKETEFEQQDNNFVFTTKVNYPNNPTYVKQQITLDKNSNLKQVKVLDEKNIPYVEFSVSKIDKKPSFNEDYFNLEKVAKEYQVETNDTTQSETKDETNNNQTTEETTENERQETTNEETTENERQETEDQRQNNNTQNTNEETTTSLEDSLFPFYLPTNTSLSNKETIQTENGQRMIMTFSGDNPFILVQETVSKSDELTIVPTYGEPFLLIDTVGSLTDVSYTWTSNGIEYYIASDTMNKQELLQVAKSLNVVATINEK
jgi:outer membrane lipoprotein-sorting protein